MPKMYMLYFSIHTMINLDQSPKNMQKSNSLKKVLIVGAGGIGCQLIKNFVKPTRFSLFEYKLTLIDFDTVAETNLNRQFCFRKENIGQSKVEVLKEYFKQINPSFSLDVYNQNLYSFSTLFFHQFHLLISALDNSEARDYLNKMAIANNIPMIDAGTSGYFGQAQSYIRFQNQCRFCRPQEIQSNSTAVCSVRNTPTRNIHCVHFGLEVFKGIFNTEQDGIWKNFSEQLLAKQALFQTILQKSIEFHNYLFYDQIKISASLQTHPIEFKKEEKQKMIDFLRLTNSPKLQDIKNIIENQIFAEEQKLRSIWAKNEFSFYFVASLFVLLKECTKLNSVLIYDKDQDFHVLFLHCLVNLRIINFQNTNNSKLKPTTFLESKDLSGKIIPAIASTNAIAAGLQFTYMQNILKNQQLQRNTVGEKQSSNWTPKYISIRGFLPSDHYKIESIIPQKPNPHCKQCSKNCQYLTILCNLNKTTFSQLQNILSISLNSSQFFHRDLQCKCYGLIRYGKRPFLKNLNSPLSFNSKLIQIRLAKSNQGLDLIKYETLSLYYYPREEYPIKWQMQLIHVESSENLRIISHH